MPQGKRVWGEPEWSSDEPVVDKFWNRFRYRAFASTTNDVYAWYVFKGTWKYIGTEPPKGSEDVLKIPK